MPPLIIKAQTPVPYSSIQDPHSDHTGYHVLSAIVFLFGISAVAHFLSRRLRIRDVKPITYASYPRLLIILLFVDSWMFLFTGAILVQGVGMQRNGLVCRLGIFCCISFYYSSKVFVYLFFIHKVLAGWYFPPNVSRKTSPVFLFCTGLLFLYAGLVIYLVIERLSVFSRANGSCMIGLKSVASIPLFTFDLLIALALTSLLLWPLYRSHISDAPLRATAIRNFWATVVALFASCINVFILMLLNGRQLAWVCLASCSLDVIVNASALFWVSSEGNKHVEIESSSESSSSESSMSKGSSDKGLAASTISGTLSTVPPTMQQKTHEAQGSPTIMVTNAPHYAVCEVDPQPGSAKEVLEDYIGHSQPPTCTRSGSWPGSKISSALGFKKNESKPHLEVNITTECDIVHEVGFDVSRDPSAEENQPKKKPRVHYHDSIPGNHPQ